MRFERWSAKPRSRPKTMSDTAISGIVPSFSSMVSPKSPPIRKAGTDDRTSSQASRPSGVERLAALEDHAQAVAGVDDQVAPEVGDDGDERPDVQRHVEGLLDALAAAAGEVVPVEQPGDQQEVARGRDGQELGQALHDPEDDGVEDGHRALAGGSAERRRAGSAARYVAVPPADRHHAAWPARRPGFQADVLGTMRGRHARWGSAWWPTIRPSRSLARKSAGPSKSGIST